MTPVPNTRRLTVHVMRDGDNVGFHVHHDKHKRLRVSAVHDKDLQLHVGDTLLSVNEIDLTGQAFSTVLQHRKVTQTRELVFVIERHEPSACIEKIVPPLQQGASGATTVAVFDADSAADRPGTCTPQAPKRARP